MKQHFKSADDYGNGNTASEMYLFLFNGRADGRTYQYRSKF